MAGSTPTVSRRCQREKATSRGAAANVRFRPIADIQPPRNDVCTAPEPDVRGRGGNTEKETLMLVF
jgi:hypothetical protein